MAERTPSGSAATAPIRPKIDPKMHETAKIVLKPPYMRLDSGALMDSKLHIERVQSFSLRPSDKKPEIHFYERSMWFHRFWGRNRHYALQL